MAIDQDTLAALRDLQSDSDPHFIRDFYKLYLTSSHRHFRGLIAAVEASDAQRLQAEAHALKSCCSNAGFPVIAAICQKLEKLGDAGSTEGAVELTRELISAYEASRREVEALPEVKQAA